MQHAGETSFSDPPIDRDEGYRRLRRAVDSVLGGETDPIVWMATLSCLIREGMGFFWVGFYLVRGGELVIGPYQGSLGCLRISFDRGVCGACARSRETIVVADVDAFPGHIACDSRSRSEIVVPVLDSAGDLRAVLDIDSDQPAHFGETDRRHLEDLVSAMRDLRWTLLD